MGYADFLCLAAGIHWLRGYITLVFVRVCFQNAFFQICQDHKHNHGAALGLLCSLSFSVKLSYKKEPPRSLLKSGWGGLLNCCGALRNDIGKASSPFLLWRKHSILKMKKVGAARQVRRLELYEREYVYAEAASGAVLFRP